MEKSATGQLEPQDEFFLDTPTMRNFIAGVRQVLASEKDVSAGLDKLQPSFAALLADQTWLPAEFVAPNPASGMGGAIGTWLLFRAADHSLSLFSLVVPSGSETPVHDHLAWGLVGLYRGEQIENVYRRTDDGSDPHRAILEVAEINNLQPGSFYKLLPPDGDIHSVKTSSKEASVSIHLLANDTGCVVRHAFDPDHSALREFRSGYSNVACPDES
ncbi:MAG TPA: cysteine dioxygenase family protein [Chloroflexia bacterium]|nr:cysteine dioxygenase family protein [Chloroflexia bacterium]